MHTRWEFIKWDGMILGQKADSKNKFDEYVLCNVILQIECCWLFRYLN